MQLTQVALVTPCCALWDRSVEKKCVFGMKVDLLGRACTCDDGNNSRKKAIG